MTEEDLMLAYAAGDASAFDRLYQQNKIAVYRFFIRQNVSQAIAEELCHDAWLKVIKARETYQASAQFRTYLFTIARHVLFDFQSKKSTLNERTSYDESGKSEREESSNNKTQADELLTHNEMAEGYQNKGLKKALHDQINQLPFEQKQVFILKQESGFSLEQIADITQQNKEKVKSRWRYALQKLREGLSVYVN